METFAFSKLKVLMAVIPASLVISSCSNSDLKAAQKFGESQVDLKNLNSAVAKEIYDSCARSSAWLAQGTAETRSNMRTGVQDCDEFFRPNSVNFETAGNILIEYVKAVGTLATENREAVQTSFDEIETALGELRLQQNVLNEAGVTTPQTFQLRPQFVTAGVNIAEFITNFLLANFRRQNLRVALVCTDQSIQDYSSDLAYFVSELYVKAQLDYEISNITAFYARYPSPLTNRNNQDLPTTSPTTFTSLQDTQLGRDQSLRGEVAKVVEKKNMGSTYASLLQATAAAHADLKRIFNDGEDKISPELNSKCEEYFADEPSDSDSSSTPKTSDYPEVVGSAELEFMNKPISPSELKQAKAVLKDYVEKVELLMEDVDLPAQ